MGTQVSPLLFPEENHEELETGLGWRSTLTVSTVLPGDIG